mmetsp:Transcript_43257/g.74681  ORF Transcript_43257/g.74681 Transcript_43257/m.74681 type:complete len:229 (+) Transcript_43257:44-730(+)
MGRVKKAKKYRFHSSTTTADEEMPAYGDFPSTKEHLIKKLEEKSLAQLQAATSLTEDKGGKTPEDAEAAAIIALSRGQRKRAARRERFLKKMNLVNQAKSVEELSKQGVLGSLGSIKDVLLNSDIIASSKTNAAKAPQKVVHNKAKKTVAAQEVQHLSLVLKHPQFMKDPIAAIQEHLRNSLPTEDGASDDITTTQQQQQQQQQKNNNNTSSISNKAAKKKRKKKLPS